MNNSQLKHQGSRRPNRWFTATQEKLSLSTGEDETLKLSRKYLGNIKKYQNVKLSRKYFPERVFLCKNNGHYHWLPIPEIGVGVREMGNEHIGIPSEVMGVGGGGAHKTSSAKCSGMWLSVHCKNWGVKLTPVGVNRGPHPQVLKLHPRVWT